MTKFTVEGIAFYAKGFNLTIEAESLQQAEHIVAHHTFDDDGEYSLNEVCIQGIEQLESPWTPSPQD